MKKVDPLLCPVCGNPNDCGVARGEKQCWCMSIEIPPERLAKIPESHAGMACLCRACAGQSPAAADAKRNS